MKWDGTWHPLAERFPMLPEEQLRDMAASIAELGQFVPCWHDADGVGLDGRNRVAACAIAGVKPVWQVHDGDPVAFIVSVNRDRRHMSTGQQAMAVAIGLANAGKRVNGRWSRGSVPDMSTNRLTGWHDAMHRAGVVLDDLPDAVDEILADKTDLGTAYADAVETRKRKKRLAEIGDELAGLVAADVITLEEAERRAEMRAAVADLDEDLAEHVTSGAYTLASAQASMRERVTNEREMIASAERAVTVISRMAGYPIPDLFIDGRRSEKFGDVDPMDPQILAQLVHLTEGLTQ